MHLIHLFVKEHLTLGIFLQLFRQSALMKIKSSKHNEVEFKATILNQAKKLFKIFGYEKLVMQDIARAVGKGRSTLYIYFKDKEAIFNAIIEEEILDYIANLSTELAKHDSAIEKLRAYVKIKFDFRHAKAAEYLMLTQEMVRQPDILMKMRVFSDPPETEHLAQIIRLGIKNENFAALSDEQIVIASRLIISSLNGISTDLIAAGTRDLSPIRNLLPEMFLRSLSIVTD